MIVGGGPAGVHMSACLATKGFKQVTLLEAEAEAGRLQCSGLFRYITVSLNDDSGLLILNGMVIDVLGMAGRSLVIVLVV